MNHTSLNKIYYRIIYILLFIFTVDMGITCKALFYYVSITNISSYINIYISLMLKSASGCEIFLLCHRLIGGFGLFFVQGSTSAVVSSCALWSIWFILRVDVPDLFISGIVNQAITLLNCINAYFSCWDSFPHFWRLYGCL